MGYPDATVGTRSCWWPGGTKRYPGTLGISMPLIQRAAVQMPLCASADTHNFYFSLWFLVSLSSKLLFPFNNTTQNFTTRDSAPVGSLPAQHRRKQVFALAG